MGWNPHRTLIRAIGLALIFLLSLGLSQAFSAPPPPPAYPWNLPPNVPKPLIPANNPMTIAKVELGRHLFYEK
ncbi:MAG: hypothetical protein MH252_18470, partial [Thermosynechococcaceae cyanobacterium MS004]|nr:hypothetical protein [Thermosynechococcaceae cyanobacterium MS004]